MKMLIYTATMIILFSGVAFAGPGVDIVSPETGVLNAIVYWVQQNYPKAILAAYLLSHLRAFIPDEVSGKRSLKYLFKLWDLLAANYRNTSRRQYDIQFDTSGNSKASMNADLNDLIKKAINRDYS